LPRDRRAYRIYLGLELALGVCLGLVYTTVAVYLIDVAGLNPLQLVLVGTAMEVTYFSFQIPTGVLADTVSRRGCVVAGVVSLGVGCGLEGLIPQFWGILLAQVFAALGFSLLNGAEEAWVAAELGTERLTRVYLRGSQAGLVGTLFGTVASAAVASVRLNLPLLVGAVALVLLAGVLTLVMPETAGPSQQRRGALLKDFSVGAGTTWRTIRFHPVFLLVFGVVALLGSWSEGLDRLWGAHLLADYTLPTFGGLSPVTWFSVLSVAATLLGLAANQLIGRRVDETGSVSAMRLLLGTVAVLSVATVVFALAADFSVAIAAYLVAGALRYAYTPVLDAWLAKRTEERVRATMLSAKDMFDSGGQVIGGPIIGVVGAAASVRAAIVAAALMLPPAGALLLLALRRLRRAPEAEAPPEPEYLGSRVI
jgi:DHA3 family tetracycline resistance protein-like MFS transporter